MARNRSFEHPRALAAALLVLVTLAAFAPVLRNDFIDYDDDRYVTGNSHVQHGLTLGTLLWAATATYASNWHPLTWISHALDWEFYGPKPFGHHLTSLLLHVANTLLVFLLLERMTGAVTRSAFAAALFGVHPLHVQSVAWIAERKDVLSTFFWLLAILAYVRYRRNPGPGRYALLVATFSLGLAAKPMLVTLPLTLLVLDFWPLGARRLLSHKMPLLAISAASAAITLVAQRSGHALADLGSFPLLARAENALVSSVVYLAQALWPARLSVFYPREEPTLWAAVASGMLLAAITWFAVRERGRRPYLLAGWLWYLITLVPVLGLVQVGAQARADRYTYVPLIGIFWAIPWGVASLTRPGQDRRAARWGVLLGAAAVLALALATRRQVGMWRNSETLFSRALEIEPRNFVAHNNLGVALAARGRSAEAIRHYEEALRLRPDYAKGHSNLAHELAAEGRLAEALDHAKRAAAYDPGLEDARFHLGSILSAQGRTSEAIEQYGLALRLDPDDAQVHNNLGSALARAGRMEEAIREIEAALRIRPDYGAAHANLAAAYFAAGRHREAREEIGRARRCGYEPPAQLVRDLSIGSPSP